MANITKFNRTNLKAVNSEIQAAIDTVAAKYGLSIKTGNIRFQDNEFTTKITATTLTSASGESMAPGQTEWENHCWKFGLKKEQFGATFESNGTTFTVSGIKPRSTKYPVLGINANGTTYKFPARVLNGWDPSKVKPING